MTLHYLLAWGLLIIIAAGLGLVGWLLYAGTDGNAVAVIVTVVMAIVSQVSQIVRHLFPAPEFEADPPARRDERNEP